MASTLTLDSKVPLPNSTAQIPRLGFGVYRSRGETCVRSCAAALAAGYRHIDTAQYYANEAEVGRAVRESGIARADVFITSKILGATGDVAATHRSIVDSVDRLDARPGGYVDLFLIHNASGSAADNQVMWTALEQARAEGKVRDIGVSNAGRKHIEALKQHATIWPPAVNQIELHPWTQQREAVEYSRSQGIVVEAYCPLVRNRRSNDLLLVDIAQKHSRTTAQVLIRYSLQRGWVPLPKSDTPERIVANAQVYDFELDGEDMRTLNSLDRGADGALVQAVDN